MDKTDNEELPYLFRNRKKKEGKFQKTSCFTLLYIWKFFTQKTCKRLLDSLFSEIYFKKNKEKKKNGPDMGCEDQLQIGAASGPSQADGLWYDQLWIGSC